MTYNNNIYDNEDRDKIQKTNAIEVLNSISESQSIKDLLLKKRSDNGSLENVSKVKSKLDDREDNSNGTYKIANFL